MPQLLVQLQHLIDDVPEDFLLVLQSYTMLAPLFLPVLWYCTGVLLAVGRIFPCVLTTAALLH